MITAAGDGLGNNKMPSFSKPFGGLSKINLEGLRFRLIDAENQVGGLGDLIVCCAMGQHWAAPSEQFPEKHSELWKLFLL